MITIRKSTAEDKEQVWEIIRAVISTGDTYTFAPESPREKMLEFWFAEDKKTYVAELSAPPASAGGSRDSELRNADVGFDEEQTTDPKSEIPNPKSNKIVGTFFLKDNQTDLGSHVANAGYMVAPDAKGLGVGRRMAEFSLDEARRLGYRAMQFNFVVKTNAVAVRLWQDLGFEIIGEIPEAFQHREHGLTNALIMYRKL